VSDLDKELERQRKLKSYNGPDRIVTSWELLDELHEQYKNHPLVELHSKIPTLDAHIHGFVPGEMTTISGETGQGKTLFAQSLTDAFVNQKAILLWFTFEVAPYQFMQNFGDTVPLFMIPREHRGYNIDWVMDKIEEAKIKTNVNAVFIDHLHFLIDMGRKHHNVSLEIGHVCRCLKRTAIDLEVSLFLLAHTQKADGSGNAEGNLTNNSIRDSSFVAQESDNVFFVRRNPVDPVQTAIKITKNRRFGVMNAFVHLRKIGNFLREV